MRSITVSIQKYADFNHASMTVEKEECPFCKKLTRATYWANYALNIRYDLDSLIECLGCGAVRPSPWWGRQCFRH
jgi:hypothetical protein